MKKFCLSAEPAGGEKKIHVFSHSQKNKIFRQKIIIAADGHLQNKNA